MKRLFVLAGIVTLISAAYPTADLVTTLENFTDISFGLYSGYIPINDTQKQLHYIATLSMNDPTTDPVIIWFSGGPGCSSTLAFAYEIGPYVIDNGVEFIKNDYAWNNEATVIYIDAPAGVPYSICANTAECNFDDNSTADDNLMALLNLMQQKFPDLQTNDLYLAGESYAGIYVPTLAYRLDQYITNNTGKEGVYIPKFKGFMVGNGVTDWKYDGTPAYFHMSYHYGLIDSALYNNVNANCDISYYDVEETLSPTCQGYMDKFAALTNGVNIYDMYGKCESSPSQTHVKLASFLKRGEKHTLKVSPPCTNMDAMIAYFKLQTVRDSLHIPAEAPEFTPCVGNGATWNYTSTKNASFDIYVDLKTKYKMLHFSGDTDGAVGTWGTQQWFNNLNATTEKEWRSYTFDSQTAGYITEKDMLKFVTIHGAGHTAAQLKRPQVYHVIFNFIKGTDI